MITFIILRLLDIWSTLLSVSTFGIDLETNPEVFNVITATTITINIVSYLIATRFF